MSDIIQPKAIEQPAQNKLSDTTITDVSAVPIVSLKGYFNIELPTVEEQNCMQWIYSYFESIGTPSTTEMLLNLRGVEQQLGMAQLGESRVKRLYQYFKLNKQISDLQQLKLSMHGK